MAEEIVYGLIFIATMLALLAAYVWATREDRRAGAFIDDDMHPGVIFGDASLLDHPTSKKPVRQEKREPEPRGA